MRRSHRSPLNYASRNFVSLIVPRNPLAQLQEGSFPACFMVVAGVLAYNSFLRQARSVEDGHLHHFVPAFVAMLTASLVANRGAAMQRSTSP